MAGSVQFKGTEQVMQAFQNRDVDAWSVWQHKQFMFKGMGDAELQTLLDNLASSATNAIYTIKVYETITDVKNIKEKTECDGSFNFRLNDERQEITGSQYHNVTRFSDMQKKIDNLELQLQEKENEIDDEPETIGAVANSAIVEIIKDPNKALQWMEVIKNIFSPGATHSPGPAVIRQIQAPAAVGNIKTIIPEEEKLDRLEKAIDILEKNDPDLIGHLEKLATIAAQKPAAFKNLLSMLELL